MVEVRLDAIREKCAKILTENDKGSFTLPTNNGLYPGQWNWDSGFVALGYAHLGKVDRAWRELETLFSGQWANGMVPSILFHVDDSSYFPNASVWEAGHDIPSTGISQPPVAATFARMILDHDGKSESSLQRAKVLVPQLYRYQEWFHKVRDPDHRGLVRIIHPWESGLDNNPVFDGPLSRVPVDNLEPYVRKDTNHADVSHRPSDGQYDAYIALLQKFKKSNYDQTLMAETSPLQVEDVCVNSLLLRADRDLLALAKMTGFQELVPVINTWIDNSEKGIQRLWSERINLFSSFDICAENSIELPTVAGFFPLFSGPLPSTQVERLAKVADSWMEIVTYGIPSFDPKSPLFDSKRYWRGPTWLITNWIVARGFLQNGRHDLYQKIQKCSLELCLNKGFFEYYDPLDGSGCGGPNFSWTSAVALMEINDL